MDAIPVYRAVRPRSFGRLSRRNDQVVAGICGTVAMSAGFEVFPRPQTQNLRIRLRQQTQGTGHRRLSVQSSGNLLSRIGMSAGST